MLVVFGFCFKEEDLYVNKFSQSDFNLSNGSMSRKI